MTRPWRPLGAAVVALLVGTLVAGCVSLPDSSSVNPGRGAGVHENQGPIGYSPPGPQPDASRTAVVEGYMQAMLAFPQSPDLVREFLTPSAALDWQPGQQLLVYENASVNPGPGSIVAFSAQRLGSLDIRGSWTSANSSDQELAINLTLQRVGGRWRISNPLPGTLLDTDTFDRYYHQYSLYYFDPTHNVLTPDPVYELLGSPSHTATALVQNLLLGPTRSMAGVVTSEVPRTTRLAPEVTVSDSGVAEIPLTRQVLSLSEKGLRDFAAQLAWTLRQERLGINRVRLTVGDQLVRIPGVPDAFRVDLFQGYSPTILNASASLFALSDGRLVTVSANGAYSVAGALGNAETTARSAAVMPNSAGSPGALVTQDGTSVVVGEVESVGTLGNSRWFSGGHDLLKPSWDNRGLLWLVDLTPGGHAVIHVVTRTSQEIVDAPGVTGEDVRAFAVSRDGMRFAAVVGRGKHAVLKIGMIQRSAISRLDVALTAVKIIANAQFPLVNLNSVSWYSPTMVAVLAQEGGSDAQPYQISIDGSRVLPTSGFLPVRPVTLAADAERGVPPVIGTRDGRIYIRTPDLQWERLSARQRLLGPTYPG